MTEAEQREQHERHQRHQAPAQLVDVELRDAHADDDGRRGDDDAALDVGLTGELHHLLLEPVQQVVGGDAFGDVGERSGVHREHFRASSGIRAALHTAPRSACGHLERVVEEVADALLDLVADRPDGVDA